MSSYDTEDYWNGELNYLFQGRELKPGWRKVMIDKAGEAIRNSRGIKLKEPKLITKEQLANNKFYVGSNSIFNRAGGNWGHKTLEEAIAHGEQLLASKSEDNQQIIIVQIVKVIRRKPIDVLIEDV